MKKLRILVCTLVILSMSALSVFCMGAALPENSEMVLNLLPEFAADTEPLDGHEDRYDPSVEDGSYSMTLLAPGANQSETLTSFAQSNYEINKDININETQKIRFKSHFSNNAGLTTPRVNMNIKFTVAGATANIMITDLTDIFDVNDEGRVIADQEKTIDFYKELEARDLVPNDGKVTIDMMSFYMGGDEGLVLTYDYVYFEKGEPLAATDSNTAGNTSSAASDSSKPSTAPSSTPKASTVPSAPSDSDENGNLVLYIVIGAAALLVVAGIIALIVIKSKKAGNTDAPAEVKPEEKAENEAEDKSAEDDKKE